MLFEASVGYIMSFRPGWAKTIIILFVTVETKISVALEPCALCICPGL